MTKINKFFVVLTFAIFTFIYSTQSVFACSCAGTPTALDSYNGAKLVVATKLVSVEKFNGNKPVYNSNSIKSAKMVVEKVYKGNVEVGDELTFTQGDGANCVWMFSEKQIGNEFLFYLDAPRKPYAPIHMTNSPQKPNAVQTNVKPMYHAITCGGSKKLEDAKSCLLYTSPSPRDKRQSRMPSSA